MKVLLALRSILAVSIFAVATFLFSASAIVFSFFSVSNRIPRLHIKLWGLLACWLFGVKVRVHGKDLWKRDSGGVVVFNHTSYFDIFAMVGFLPDMRFGAKVELFKIPIFGAAMKRVGILPIDRERREKVFAIYQQAVDRLTVGEKIALAPEGKRTSDPQHLAPFKSGPFVFALQSKVEIIPVVIKGAYEIYPKGQWLPNTKRKTSYIDLFVLEPTPTKDSQQEEKTELQNKIRLQMQNILDQTIEQTGLKG